MGVYVRDGLLLGLVIAKYETIKNLYEDEIKRDDVFQKIQNVIKLENEDAISIFDPCDVYNESPICLGIFEKWSERRALELDELWKPLFIEHPRSSELLNSPKYSKLSKKLYETLQNYFPNLNPADIRIYQVRFWV